jgi:hypothetical protein
MNNHEGLKRSEMFRVVLGSDTFQIKPGDTEIVAPFLKFSFRAIFERIPSIVMSDEP